MRRSNGNRDGVEKDDERLARDLLASVRRTWRTDTARASQRAPRSTDRNLIEACALSDKEPVAFRPNGFEESTMPAEARRALALWTRYRIVCLELLGSERTGQA
jgi:hypothetical protein